MSGTLRGKLLPGECRRSYSRLREQEEDSLHQDNVHQNNGQGRDDNAVGGSTPNAFSALVGGVSEVRGDKTDHGSEDGRLKGWRNKGRPAHAVESAGNVELDGEIRGGAFREVAAHEPHYIHANRKYGK